MSANSDPTRTRRRRRNSERATEHGHVQRALVTDSSAVDAGVRPGSEKTCPFFARGHCRYGDHCKQRHAAPGTIGVPLDQLVPPNNLESQHPAASPSETMNDHRTHLRSKPCFAWRKGSCSRGDQCRFAHDTIELTRTESLPHFSVDTSISLPQGRVVQQKIENEARAHERARKAEQDRQRKDEQIRLREAAAERKKAERAEEEARALEQRKLHQQERHRLDALFTIQRVPFGSTIVTFGAGAQIESTVAGFETCRVTIKNIPSGVQMNQLSSFLNEAVTENAKQKLHLVSLKRWDQAQEGVVLAEVDVAKDLIRRLDGAIFKEQSLKLHLQESGKAGGMHLRTRDTFSLKITWRDPSARCIVTYLSESCADEERRRFDGTVVFGRKVKIEVNTDRYKRSTPNQLLISGLPCEVTDEDVRTFFDGRAVRRISGQGLSAYDARLQLTEHIRHCCYIRSITPPNFDESQIQTNTAAHEHTISLWFNKWDSAKQIHDLLSGQKFHWLGNAFLRLWLPDPIQYEITIPFNQYQAQHPRWKSLLNDNGGKKDLRMRINEKPDKDRVFVQVGGNDAKAVGMLKVRIENLAAGEKLGVWHRSFDTDFGRSFLRDLLQVTKALVIPDWRLKTVKAYGDPAAIEKAREAIDQEIVRLAGLEYTVTLKRESVRFFVQQGIAYLKERFGEENVTLSISGLPRVTIRGGEDARHALYSLIEQSRTQVVLSGNDRGSSLSCPICLDDVSVPVQLGCGHEYCSACLHHFFAADVKNFPIVCLGDELRCGQPIALPTIQRFLTEPQFNALLESAFLQYVERNPELFKYCPTPACEQLYRCADPSSHNSNANACCPSCLCEICTRCHENHKGMTCDERRRARNDQENNEELNAQWAEKTGVKRCPKCSLWIEKTEGCNHISCRCGAHICWRCMGIFESTAIYQHMNTAHGGIGQGDGLIQNVDYDVQAQARELDIWNNFAAARRFAQALPRPVPIPQWQMDHREELRREEDLRRQQQEQRMRDLEATQRRARQEEGGNWCMIM
ncbi:hypothetical protein EV361DRAFT_958414 [Lentinula raphanica]|nr:hypothetical protein EV361DRAFT_958414 [Lentinula raphanica]